MSSGNIARAAHQEHIGPSAVSKRIALLEENVGAPLAPVMFTTSLMHCMTVSLAQGGAGLGAMWGEQTARRMLAEAGFTDIAVHRVEGDAINSYYVARTGP